MKAELRELLTQLSCELMGVLDDLKRTGNVDHVSVETIARVARVLANRIADPTAEEK